MGCPDAVGHAIFASHRTRARIDASCAIRRDCRRIGHLRRMGRQGAHREGPARPAARARPQRRAHQGLRQRDQGAVGVPAPRRTHESDGRAVPGAQARLPAEREEPRLLGVRQGHRPTPRSSGSTGTAAIRWAAARSCGDGRATAGASSTSRPTRRTASRSTGRSATRTSRRGTTTSSVTPGIAGSREGLPQLPDGQFQPGMPLNCGEELVAGRLSKAFDGKRRLIIGRVANLTRPLRGPRRLPVPQRLLAGLSLRRVLQHAVIHAAGRGEDRTTHAQAVRRSSAKCCTTRTASERPACASSMP